MHNPGRTLAACIVALSLLAAAGASGQDRSVLEERGAPRPGANLAPLTLPAGFAHPRILLAGDSWAQYMWDDGSHNDILDKFGQADKTALSRSLGSDPGPGYSGPEYAISGSEARQWVDTANYPWVANMTAALRANPTIDYVMLSIDGNDVLAGKSDGGWYKDMDLDAPGAEDSLFARIHRDTDAIIDSALAVRPELKVLLSSYDYPNFNVGFWCFVYACPERKNLSRDPTNDLITDQELNGMIVTAETRRMAWVNALPRALYDDGVGLTHYWYGDGQSAALTLPFPGQSPPDYLPFPGGNPLRPTLRSNFRVPNGIDADPIHLNFDPYQYKITNQVETTFFPAFRGVPTATFQAAGGGMDGWTDGASTGTGAIRVGDTGAALVDGIVTFDTSAIPDGAAVTGAAFYLVRQTAAGTSPFAGGALGLPAVDVASGTFGAPAVEAGDATAPAGAVDAGTAVGSAKANGYAVRVELSAAGIAALNLQGLTQFRLRFPAPDADGTADYAAFYTGDAGPPPVSAAKPTLADYMGSYRPFLDVTYSVPTGVADGSGIPAPRIFQNSPNPFGPSTSIAFALPARAPARIEVFDVAGRRVRALLDATMDAGPHAATWDGRDDAGSRVAAGVYLARLTALGRSSTVRMVVLDR